jgi:hypothetical protein
MGIKIALVEKMWFTFDGISTKNDFAPRADSFFPRSVGVSA